MPPRVRVWDWIGALVTCCLLPNHMNYIVLVLSFSRCDNIHLSSSLMHVVIRGICTAHDAAGVRMGSSVSSAYECGVIPWQWVIPITLVVYSRNNTGPRTLPCGMPQTIAVFVDCFPLKLTVWVCCEMKDNKQSNRNKELLLRFADSFNCFQSICL